MIFMVRAHTHTLSSVQIATLAPVVASVKTKPELGPKGMRISSGTHTFNGSNLGARGSDGDGIDRPYQRMCYRDHALSILHDQRSSQAHLLQKRDISRIRAKNVVNREKLQIHQIAASVLIGLLEPLKDSILVAQADVGPSD